MRLDQIIIRRFKAIDHIELTIPDTNPNRPGSADFLSLVGENNTSKSSVLQAIMLALPGTELSRPTNDHFPGRDEQNGPIEVELHFTDLTEAETQRRGIRTHVHDGFYRLRKVWNQAGVSAVVSAWEPDYQFPTWPENDRSWTNFREADERWTEVLNRFAEAHGELGRTPNQDQRIALKGFLIETESPLAEQLPPAWKEHPGGFAANVDSNLPECIYVPAIRETEDEVDVSKTNSAARSIVQAMFTRQLADHEAISKFTEAGEAVRELFAGDEGSEIIRSVEESITLRISRFIDLSAKLNFDPPDVKADLAGRTSLGLIDPQLQLLTSVVHQGHGAQRALILSLLELLAEDKSHGDDYHKPILFLIEEPEIYLHPQMCRRMRDVLLSISREQTAQVICTTHSPVFIDLADRHDGIVVFRKLDGHCYTTQRTEDLYPGEDTQDCRRRLRMLLNFDPSVNESFFSQEVCLVEGDSEIAAVEAVAEKLSSQGQLAPDAYREARRKVVFVNCRGKWTICAFQRVLNAFDIRYRIIHDLDNEGNQGANAAILELVDGDASRIRTHDPNFEEFLFGQKWASDKPWRARRTILEMDEVPAPLQDFFHFAIGNLFD